LRVLADICAYLRIWSKNYFYDREMSERGQASAFVKSTTVDRKAWIRRGRIRFSFLDHSPFLGFPRAFLTVRRAAGAKTGPSGPTSSGAAGESAAFRRLAAGAAGESTGHRAETFHRNVSTTETQETRVKPLKTR